MTVKAKKQKLNGENTMNHSFENKSFTLEETNVEIQFKLVTPAMAAKMLKDQYEEICSIDLLWQSQCEKAICAGLNTDENTGFLISIDDSGLFVDGACVLAAIVEVNTPAVVAFASNIPETGRILVDCTKKDKERFTYFSNRALDIKDSMENVLAEFYQTEEFKRERENLAFDSSALSEVYYRLFDSFNFLPRREYAKKVAECEEAIRENTLGMSVEWFGACWMLAEYNGKDAPFFQAIAYDKPELCEDAKKYMERSKYWLDNLPTMSDESIKKMKAKQKIKLKFTAEQIYYSWLNEIKKAN